MGQYMGGSPFPRNDDALAPGEELPDGPSDEEVERMAERLHAQTAEGYIAAGR